MSHILAHPEVYGIEPGDVALANEVNHVHMVGELMAAAAHPNIVTFEGFAEDAGDHNPYIITELCTNDLEGYLEGMGDRRLTLNELHSLCAHVLTALAHLHSLPTPIIHRDIKPSCILACVQEPGNPASQVTWKIGGFTVARYLPPADDDAAAHGGRRRMSIAGTPLFLPPEVIATHDGGPYYDGKADVFSFGLTLAMIVMVGMAPAGTWRIRDVIRMQERAEFVGRAAAALAELGAQPFAAVLEACCRADPDVRFTAAEALAAVQALPYGAAAVAGEAAAADEAVAGGAAGAAGAE